MALNSGILTYQILTNDDEVCISSLSSNILNVQAACHCTEEFLKKYKSNEAYYGKKTNKQGLSRWFKEEWKNQRGDVGYKNKNDVYRPTRRVTPKTPLTFNELTKYELTKAKKIKETKGRVYRFRNKK